MTANRQPQTEEDEHEHRNSVPQGNDDFPPAHAGRVEPPAARPRADRSGRQPDGHPQVRLRSPRETPGHCRPVVIMDAVQQLAQPCEAVLERFHVDTRYIAAKAAAGFKGGIVPNRRDGRLWHDLRDEFGIVWSMPDDHPYYMDISHHPLAKATLADIAAYPFPKGDDPGRFEGLRERALMLKGETPYAVVSGISGVVYEICWYIRGLEQWLMDLFTEPEFCEAILDQTLKFWLDWFRVFLDEVGDVVDVIMIGDDLAGQNGPALSPGDLSHAGQAASEATGAIHPFPHAGQDLVSHLRRVHGVHPRPARQRHRHPQPGPGQRQGHGSGGAQGPLRRPAGILGRRDRRPARPALPRRPRRSASTSAGIWPPGSPTAATSSTTSIIFRGASLPRISLPSTTRLTNSASTNAPD